LFHLYFTASKSTIDLLRKLEVAKTSRNGNTAICEEKILTVLHSDMNCRI